jgi:hypothetical protein
MEAGRDLSSVSFAKARLLGARLMDNLGFSRLRRWTDLNKQNDTTGSGQMELLLIKPAR